MFQRSRHRTSWPILGFAVTAVIATSTGSVDAADVRGTLSGLDSLQPTPAPEVPSGRRLFYWEEPNGALDVRRARAIAELDLTVILSGPNIGEVTQPVGFSVVGGRCRPGTAVVAVNTVLRIQNNDWFPHEFFIAPQGQNTPVANVQPETTAPRSERQVQIAQGGVYELRDRLSPTFRCFVLVGPGQGRVAQLAQDGAYRFAGLQDGDYSIKVYFEGRMISETTTRVANNRDVTVPVINLAAPAAAPGAAAGGPGAAGGAGAPGAPGGANGAAAAGAAPAAPSGGGRRRRGGR